MRSNALVRAAATVLLAGAFVTPMALMVLGSLRSPLLPPAAGLDVWPDDPRWSNYDSVGSFLDWPTYLLNSAAVVSVAVPVTVLVSSAAGFLLRFGSTKTRWWVGAACALGLLVPASALWIPRVVLIRSIGLADHTLSIVPSIVAATAPFGVLLFFLAYARLPPAWFDVAATEGLSSLRTWWRIALPAARGASFALALITFVYAWSDFIDPLTLVSSPQRWPLALGLRSLADSEATLYPIYLAAAVLATAPAALVFLVTRRAIFTVATGER